MQALRRLPGLGLGQGLAKCGCRQVPVFPGELDFTFHQESGRISRSALLQRLRHRQRFLGLVAAQRNAHRQPLRGARIRLEFERAPGFAVGRIEFLRRHVDRGQAKVALGRLRAQSDHLAKAHHRLLPVAGGELGPAQAGVQFGILRQHRDRRLRRGQRGRAIAHAQQVLDLCRANLGVRGNCARGVSEGLCYLVRAGTAAPLDLGQRQVRARVLRVALEKLLEPDPRGLGLALLKVDPGQAGDPVEVARVPGQGLLQALARGRRVVAQQLHTGPHLRRLCAVGLLALQRIDRLQRLVELAALDPGGDQRHVDLHAVVRGRDLLQFAQRRAGVAGCDVRQRDGGADRLVVGFELRGPRQHCLRRLLVAGLQLRLRRQLEDGGADVALIEHRAQGGERLGRLAQLHIGLRQQPPGVAEVRRQLHRAVQQRLCGQQFTELQLDGAGEVEVAHVARNPGQCLLHQFARSLVVGLGEFHLGFVIAGLRPLGLKFLQRLEFLLRRLHVALLQVDRHQRVVDRRLLGLDCQRAAVHRDRRRRVALGLQQQVALEAQCLEVARPAGQHLFQDRQRAIHVASADLEAGAQDQRRGIARFGVEHHLDPGSGLFHRALQRQGCRHAGLQIGSGQAVLDRHIGQFVDQLAELALRQQRARQLGRRACIGILQLPGTAQLLLGALGVTTFEQRLAQQVACLGGRRVFLQHVLELDCRRLELALGDVVLGCRQRLCLIRIAAATQQQRDQPERPAPALTTMLHTYSCWWFAGPWRTPVRALPDTSTRALSPVHCAASSAVPASSWLVLV